MSFAEKVSIIKAMNALFIFNPLSGKGKIKKKLPLIERTLKEKFGSVEVYETVSRSDLTEKISRDAKLYDAIIFSGGDGTFNDVLTALRGEEKQLGYLPSGTVNDIARSLKIPRRVKGALKVITHGNHAKLDCIKIGDRYAMYIAAAGAFTGATYHTTQKQKRALGALAYALEAVKHDLKLKVFPVEVTTPDEMVKTHAVLILVMNGKSVAGFPINRKGSMADGNLEIAIIKQVERPNLFRRIGALFSVASLFVFGCKIRKRDILLMNGNKVRIKTDQDVIWDFDGERGPCGDTEMEVLEKHVDLFVPSANKV